jgi:hypothetical protein
MLNQKQAVKNAVLAVLPDYQLNGETILADVLTAEHKSRMKQMIVNGFLEGKIEMSREGQDKYFHNPTELGKYVVGLINNWIRKDPEFNCGIGYVTQNPGSRSGTGDAQLKALRALLKITTDSSARKTIEDAISSRVEELKPKAEIDVNALPEHIRKLIG